MQLIQFLAAWMFPGAVCFASAVEVEVAATDSSELDRASSSSPSFSATAAGSGSSLSSPSSTSSSDDGHRGFFKPRSRQESPSRTPLCFSAGAGRRLLRGSRARAGAPPKQPQEEAAATMARKVKGDVVGTYLRKISRRLRKSRRSDGKGSPSPMATVDDTARERAESVSRAISYCKDTLRRGTSRSRSPSPPPPPPPPPSPSLDDWLQDRQDEIIASAAEERCDECRHSRPSPSRPRRAGGWPLGMHTMEKRFNESPCPCSASASPSRDSTLAACAVAHGEESPQPHHGDGCRGQSSMCSLDEMEFLETFHGDEEMINHHFITVEI